MPSDLLTLPGSIPGLLRRGSPVVDVDQPERSAVVVRVYESHAAAYVAWDLPDEQDEDVLKDLSALALDLTDATGRWHAVMWLDAQDGAPHHLADMTLGAVCDARNTARQGKPMSDYLIQILRDLVMDVAGLEKS